MNTRSLHRTIHTQDEAMDAMNEVVRIAAEDASLGSRVDDIRTVVAEALENARMNLSNAGEGFDVRAEWTPGKLFVEVRNKGPMFEVTDNAPSMKDRIDGKVNARGWGTYLMKQLSDEISLERIDHRNIVRMTFKAPKPEKGQGHE